MLMGASGNLTEIKCYLEYYNYIWIEAKCAKFCLCHFCTDYTEHSDPPLLALNFIESFVPSTDQNHVYPSLDAKY